MGIGSIFGIVASAIVGGAIATVTIFGVVGSQTSPSGQSPVNVSQPVVDYGSSN